MDERIRMEKRDGGGKFVLSVDGRDVGYVTYKKIDSKTIDIDHTVVRQEHEGKGYASLLVDTVLEMADTLGLGVRASCSYAEHRMEKQGRI